VAGHGLCRACLRLGWDPSALLGLIGHRELLALELHRAYLEFIEDVFLHVGNLLHDLLGD